MMWNNVGKTTAKYYCCNKRAKDCKCNFVLNFPIINRIVDTLRPIFVGTHSRGCCIKMNVDPDLYDWDGKATVEATEENQDCSILLGKVETLLMLLLTCVTYELITRLDEPKRGFANILNKIWVAYSPMAFESSKDFIVDCKFLM
jgi:hypothetical protein